MINSTLFKLPTQPVEWMSIWQRNLKMTIPTRMGKVITVSILDIEPIYAVDAEASPVQTPLAARVIVDDGEFFVCFGDVDALPLDLMDKITFCMRDRDPKQGEWYLPESFWENYPYPND